MRITTKQIMRNYNERLNNILNNVNSASQKVISQRKFEKSSENPSMAIRANRLYRQYLNNEDYMENTKKVMGQLDMAESAMMNISKQAEDAYIDVLSVLSEQNGPSERAIYAEKFRQAQKSIIMDANAMYSDRYLFGGSSVKELPFSLDDDGTVRYRGLDVNDPANFAELQKLSDEKIYIDIGFGMTFDATAPQPNTIVPGSAFNISIPGINIIGFGIDSVTGASNNIVTTLGKLAELCEQEPFPREEIEKLSKTLDTQRKDILVDVTQIGTNSKFLEFTFKRLDDTQYTLTERLNDAVFFDPAKAITDLQNQQYIYNAALKIGSGILTPSFIDFMR